MVSATQAEKYVTSFLTAFFVFIYRFFGTFNEDTKEIGNW